MAPALIASAPRGEGAGRLRSQAEVVGAVTKTADLILGGRG
jgi:hypothetical protein